MATRFLVFIFLFISGGQAETHITSRHYNGDIFTLNGGECNWNFCRDNDNNAAAIPWAKCQCQCLPRTPVFRQDTGKCVKTIAECSDRIAAFTSEAFTETIPLVTLPENDALLYPSAEISLIDPDAQAVGPNLCVLTHLKALSENGWQLVEQIGSHQSLPTFKAVGEHGKLFLQFSGDINVRQQLSAAGVVMVTVACTQEVLKTNPIQSDYCIVFRVATLAVSGVQNASVTRNYYLIVGLSVCFLGVVFVVATLIFLLIRQQKRNRARKQSIKDEEDSLYEVVKHEQI